MDALNNSSNSISINAPQNINAFEQITTLENRISLLELENRLWRSSSILMKATFRVATIQNHFVQFYSEKYKPCSNKATHEKKDKQRVEDVPSIKDNTSVLKNEVAPQNVA